MRPMTTQTMIPYELAPWQHQDQKHCLRIGKNAGKGESVMFAGASTDRVDVGAGEIQVQTPHAAPPTCPPHAPGCCAAAMAWVALRSGTRAWRQRASRGQPAGPRHDSAYLPFTTLECLQERPRCRHLRYYPPLPASCAPLLCRCCGREPLPLSTAAWRQRAMMRPRGGPLQQV